MCGKCKHYDGDVNYNEESMTVHSNCTKGIIRDVQLADSPCKFFVSIYDDNSDDE